MAYFLLIMEKLINLLPYHYFALDTRTYLAHCPPDNTRTRDKLVSNVIYREGGWGDTRVQFYWIDGTLPADEALDQEVRSRVVSYDREEREHVLSREPGFKFLALLHDELKTLRLDLAMESGHTYEAFDTYWVERPRSCQGAHYPKIAKGVEQLKEVGAREMAYITWFSFRTKQDAAEFDGEIHLRNTLDKLGFVIRESARPNEQDYAEGIKDLLRDASTGFDDPSHAAEILLNHHVEFDTIS